MAALIKMVVFDMAGTTVDEDNVVYKTLRNAINFVGGFDLDLEEVLAHGAGREKLEAIKMILKNSLGIENDDLAKEMFALFQVQLKQAYQVEEIRPNKHAKELFQALRADGVLNVLNTGYDRATAESLLAKLDWHVGVDIDALVTASDVPQNRPFPDMIHYAMAKFHIKDPLLVAKIGDSIIDIQEGQNAGCALSIGITTGAHSPEQLFSAHPDFVIDDLLELVPILKKHSA